MRLRRNPTGDFSAPALSTFLHHDKWLKRKLSNLQTAHFFFFFPQLFSSRRDGSTQSHKTESFIACFSGDGSFPFHPGLFLISDGLALKAPAGPSLISCDRRGCGSGCPSKLNWLPGPFAVLFCTQLLNSCHLGFQSQPALGLTGSHYSGWPVQVHHLYRMSVIDSVCLGDL